MQIIKPKVEIINEPDTLKRIELAGRTCYKSEDRITNDSAEKFFKAIVKRNHTSVLEHSNLIIKANNRPTAVHLVDMLHEFAGRTMKPYHIRTQYSVPCCSSDREFLCGSDAIFSGNLRAWREIVSMYRREPLFCKLFYNHPWFEDIYMNDLKESSMPVTMTEHFDSYYHELAQGEIVPYAPGKIHNIITARFTCSRGVSHELVRHREMSFSQESTRYVKYGNLLVIEPWWFNDTSMANHQAMIDHFIDFNIRSEQDYNTYIDMGATPQLARGALNNDLKTEVVVTGTIAAWERFLALRESAAAHPDIRIIASLFREASQIDTIDWEDYYYAR